MALALVEQIIRIRSSYDSTGTDQARRDTNSLTGSIARAGEAASIMSSRFRNATLVLAAGTAGAAKVFADVQTAETNLLRVTGLQGKAFQNLMRDVRALAPQLGLSEAATANLATEASRLGIEGPNLIRFVRTAAQASKALGTDVGETATSLAKLRTNFVLSVPDLNRLTGSIIALDQASAASFPDILRAMTNVGPIARIMGLSGQQLAALSATITETGISAETTGTSLSQILQSVQKRSEQLAPFLNTTGAALRQAFQKDQIGTILKIAQTFTYLTKTGQDTSGFLKALSLDGRRATSVLAVLGDQSARLNELLGISGDEFAKGSLLAKAFGLQAGTVAFKFQQFKSQFLGAARAVGEKLAPMVMALMAGLGKLFDLIKNSPLLQFVIAVGLVGGAISTAAAFLVFFTASQVIAFKVAMTGLPAVTAQYRSLTKAIFGASTAQEGFAASSVTVGAAGKGGLLARVGGFFASRSAAGRTAAMGALTAGAGRVGIVGSYLGEASGVMGLLRGLAPLAEGLGGILSKAFWPLTIALGIFTALKDNMFGSRDALVAMVKPFMQMFGGQGRETLKNVLGIFQAITKLIGGIFGIAIRIVAEVLTPVIKVISWLVDKVFGVINLILGPIRWILEKLGLLGGNEPSFEAQEGLAATGNVITAMGKTVPASSLVKPATVAGAGTALGGGNTFTIPITIGSVRSEEDVQKIRRVVAQEVRKYAAEAR